MFDYGYIKIKDTSGDKTISQDYLIDMSASNAMAIASANADCGECAFTFYNTLFTDDEIKNFAQNKTKIEAYVKRHESSSEELYGTYYIEEVEIKEHIVSITAYDILYQLENYIYYEDNLGERTVSNAVFFMLEWLRMNQNGPTVIYDTTDTIMNQTMGGYIPAISYREALRLIGEAYGYSFFVDKNGVVRYANVARSTGKTLTDDDIVEDTIQIENKQSEEYSISVNVYEYVKDEQIKEVGRIENIELKPLSAGVSNIEYTLVYENPPIDTFSFGDEGGGLVVTRGSSFIEDYTSTYIKIRVWGIAGQVGSIVTAVIMAKGYTAHKHTILYNEQFVNKFEIDNPMVTSEGQADGIANVQRLYLYGNKISFEADIDNLDINNSCEYNGMDIIITKRTVEIENNSQSEKFEGVIIR